MPNCNNKVFKIIQMCLILFEKLPLRFTMLEQPENNIAVAYYYIRRNVNLSKTKYLNTTITFSYDFFACEKRKISKRWAD